MGVGVTGGVVIRQQSVGVQVPEGQGAVGTRVELSGQFTTVKFTALQVGTAGAFWQQSVMEQMGALQVVEGSFRGNSEGHV